MLYGRSWLRRRAALALIGGTLLASAAAQEAPPSSSPEELKLIGDHLYFSADDGKHGRELWVCELGSGASQLFDLEPGAGSSTPLMFSECGGSIVFIATTSRYGSEVWIFDPVQAQARLFWDFEPGPASTVIQLCGTGGDAFYLYIGPRAGRGAAMWTIDTRSFELSETGAWGRMEEFSGVILDDGRLVAGSLSGLSIADGVSKNAQPLLRPEVAGSIAWITSIGNRFVFSAATTAHGEELFVSDGTPEGTRLLLDICPGARGSAIRQMRRWGARAVFQADDGQTGPELWTTDGTTGGTLLIADIFAGAEGSDPHYFLPTDNRVYFAATDGVSGTELWCTDGTQQGTRRLSDLAPASQAGAVWSLVQFQGKVYFCANSRNDGEEIFYATPDDQVRILADLVPGAAGSSPGNLTPGLTSLFFTCDNGKYGEELWRSDGLTHTELFMDIRVQEQERRLSARPDHLTPLGNNVLFAATDLQHGRELWKSDGTQEGTLLVADLDPGVGDASPEEIIADAAHVFFTADAPLTGREVWTSDGTTAGTSLFAETIPGPDDATPRQLLCHHGALYFIAGPVGRESLWRADLTTSASGRAATSLVHSAGGLAELFSYDKDVYAYGSTAAGQVLLLRFDLTAAALIPLPSLTPRVDLEIFAAHPWQPQRAASADTVPAILFPPGRDRLHATFATLQHETYFAGRTAACGSELWGYDTSNGFRLVRDLFPGRASSGPSDLLVVGNKICFIAEHPEKGRVLWESDGTPTGTRVLRATEGKGGTWPPLAPVILRNAGNDRVALLAPHPQLGAPGLIEPGILSSETGEFTFRTCPRAPGSVAINPNELACAGGKVFFVCDESVYGEELWVHDIQTATTQLAKDILSQPEATPKD